MSGSNKSKGCTWAQAVAYQEADRRRAVEWYGQAPYNERRQRAAADMRLQLPGCTLMQSYAVIGTDAGYYLDRP